MAADDWTTRREALRKEWLKILGPMPPRGKTSVEILRDDPMPDHMRLLVRYETDPGCATEALLLIPNDLHGQAPGAVVFHSTSSNHIHQPAGLADAPTRHLALQLVRRGYVTICPRCFIYGYKENRNSWNRPEWTRPRGVEDFRDATQRLLADYPGWTGMGKMLWDGIRAVDVLEGWPDVDEGRIACMGHSLGGKEALYLAALDRRLRAAVASEFGIGLKLSNWDAPWYLGDKAARADFCHDHHELLALVAPRSFLLIGGGDADGPASLAWLRAAQPVYSLLGRPKGLSVILHGAGHDLPQAVCEAALDWLDTAIGRGAGESDSSAGTP